MLKGAERRGISREGRSLRGRLFHVVRSLTAAGLVTLGVSGAVKADDLSALSVRGFGTLGLARTNTDAVGFVRDLYQPDGATNRWTGKVDSLLGL